MKYRIASITDNRMILLILTAVAVIVGVAFIMTGYWAKRADMYLMPDGFKGTVTVFFNDPSGKPERRDGERRVFEIPASGTLYTQSSYKNKWNNYYYAQRGGRLRQLIYGGARPGGMPIPYSGIDSIWIEEMSVVQRDTNSKKLKVATFTVKEMP